MEIDGTCTFGSPFGSDQDNTVCGTGAIDGGRTGVLHHFDGLDVVGVEVRHGALGAVHDDQRRAGAVDAGTASENDGRFGGRVTGCLGDGKTGNSAGKGCRCLVVHTGSDGLALDGGDGVRHFRPELLSAVRGDHGLFEEVLVVGHHDGEGTAVPGGFRGGVADAGDHEDVAHLRIRLDELTLDVRHHAGGDGSALDQDGGHDDRLALCILHRSLAGAVLGEEVASSQEHDAKQRKDCKQFV